MALGDGQTQGDGKTSPFGNGKGSTGGSMAGVDFVKNPGGGGNTGSGGNNFLTDPAGKGPTGGTPMNVASNPNDKQKSGAAEDLNPESEIKDGGGLVPLADAPAATRKASDVGVGSMGESRKPFKGI